ncbi:type IV pilus modification protein PilV [Rhodanobacter glycinis]|uniref:Type IV pilus modification protein PilV n=2 Tax=Rhodanobacter glycinis TaxID=582702 RepID=A0A5B9E5M6_9GAMM|nr:type IV pilus modification protein PilV [Rhodanobacter glycinis]
MQAGVGLIEVLVAVLVLSIGFIGVAALQAMSLSTNNSAMARSMATVSSYSILDVMRIDRTSAKNGDYNTTVAGNACAGSGTLAKNQLTLWCQQLAANLGAAATTTGKVACDATGNCTVTVSYDDSRAGNGTGIQTIVTGAKL